MEVDMNKLTEREMLILIMSEQKQFKQALEEIKHVLLLKADASKLADLEKDVKELQKENSEIKRTQWLSIGGVGTAVWAIEHFFLK